MRKRIAAVLFDLDGTLLDSEPVYYLSERAFFARFGIDFSPELSSAFTGRDSSEMFRELELAFPDSPLSRMPLAERVRLKDAAYLELAPALVKPFPATVELARSLAGKGLRLAIASGSSTGVIELMLRTPGLDGLFPVRVSASEVPLGKPEPDVFLEAARRSGVDPALCLVLEDSRHGAAAAAAAGMACVALPEPGSRTAEGYATADMIIEGGAAALDPDLVLSRYEWAPGP